MRKQSLFRAAGMAAVAALTAACTSTPPAPEVPQAPVVETPRAAEEPPAVIARPPAAPSRSSAPTARSYRQDAAGHLYGLHQDRIYKGRLPPLLYAIGVLQVQVGRQGQVEGISWMRAPRHAPEVVAEIEKMVRAAAPFPVPARMGKVVYTDTWLWHRSGRFQLDTLTEGQD